jgi:hypothetical protein
MRRTPAKLRQRKARRNPSESGNTISEAIELEALGLMFSASRLMEHARQIGRRRAPPHAFSRRPAQPREQCRDGARYCQTSVADRS